MHARRKAAADRRDVDVLLRTVNVSLVLNDKEEQEREKENASVVQRIIMQ